MGRRSAKATSIDSIPLRLSMPAIREDPSSSNEPSSRPDNVGRQQRLGRAGRSLPSSSVAAGSPGTVLASSSVDVPPLLLRDINSQNIIPCAVKFDKSNDFFGGDKLRPGAGGWFLGVRSRTSDNATTTETDAPAVANGGSPVTVYFDDRSSEQITTPSRLLALQEQVVDGNRCLVSPNDPDVYCQLEPTQLALGDLVYGRFQNRDRWYRGRVAAVTSVTAAEAPTPTTDKSDKSLLVRSAVATSRCSIAYDDGDRETDVPFGLGHHGNVRKVVTPDPPHEWLDGLPFRLPSKRCRSALSGTLQVKDGEGVVEIRYVDTKGKSFLEKRAVATIIQKVVDDAWASSKYGPVPWPAVPPPKLAALAHPKKGTTNAKRGGEKAAPSTNDENSNFVSPARSGRPPLSNMPGSKGKGGRSSPARGGSNKATNATSIRRSISMTPPLPPPAATAIKSLSAVARMSTSPSLGKRTKVEPEVRKKSVTAPAKETGRTQDSDDEGSEGGADDSEDEVVEVSRPQKRRAAEDCRTAASTEVPGLRRSHRAVNRPTTYGEPYGGGGGGDDDDDDDDIDDDFDEYEEFDDDTPEPSKRATTGVLTGKTKCEPNLVTSGETLASRPAQRRVQARKGPAPRPDVSKDSTAHVEAKPPPKRQPQKQSEPTTSSYPVKTGDTEVDDDDEDDDEDDHDNAVLEVCAPYVSKFLTVPAYTNVVPLREMPLADAHKLVNALVSQSSKWSSDLGIITNDVHRLVLPADELARLVQVLLTGPMSGVSPFPDGAIVNHCVSHLKRYMTSGPDQTQMLTRCVFDRWEEFVGQRLKCLEYCAAGDEDRLNSDAFLRRSQSLHLNLCCAEIVSKLLQHGVSECINSPDTLESHPMVRRLLSHRNGLKGPLDMAVTTAAHLWVFNGVFKVGDRNLTQRSPSLPSQLSPPSEAQLWETKSNAQRLLATVGETCTYLAWLYGTEGNCPPALVAREIANTFTRELGQRVSFDPTPFLSENMSREEYVRNIKVQFVMSLGRDLVPQLRPKVVEGLGITKVWNEIRRKNARSFALL